MRKVIKSINGMGAEDALHTIANMKNDELSSLIEYIGTDDPDEIVSILQQ